MRRCAFTLLELLVIVAIISILALILAPTFQRSPHDARRESCQSNLKHLGLAMLQYAGDYNDRFPKAKAASAQQPGSPYGWADALLPYTQYRAFYQCAAQGTPGQPNPRLAEYTDYWFNRNLSGIAHFSLTAPASTVLLGEGNDGEHMTDARYSLLRFPKRWSKAESPLTRHRWGKFNVLWADGHVRSLTPDTIESSSAGQNGLRF